MQENEKPVLVRPATAARLLDCGVTSVYELMKSGRLRWVHFLDGRRIPFTELERLKQEGLK